MACRPDQLKLILTQPSLAGVGAGAELGNIISSPEAEVIEDDHIRLKNVCEEGGDSNDVTYEMVHDMTTHTATAQNDRPKRDRKQNWL